MIRKTDLYYFEIGIRLRCKNYKKSLLERGGKNWLGYIKLVIGIYCCKKRKEKVENAIT